MPAVRQRVGQVAAWRRENGGPLARSLASEPREFHVTLVPDSPFLVIPETSSERREYVPIGWLEPPVVPSNALIVFEDATLALFALLTSSMHMAWLSHIGGRLTSRLRYSNGLVYSTFPMPDLTTTQIERLNQHAGDVLSARAGHPAASFADLYDPESMPADLARAHRELDRAVDRLYRRRRFASQRERVEHLLGMYEKAIAPLPANGPAKRRRRR